MSLGVLGSRFSVPVNLGCVRSRDVSKGFVGRGLLGAFAVFGRDADEVSDGESGVDQAGRNGPRDSLFGVPGRFGSGLDCGQVAFEQADSWICRGESTVWRVLVRAAASG